MNNFLTHDQINRLREEIGLLGIPFNENIFKTANFNEYMSFIFSHITIPEIKDKISNFEKIDLKNISEKDLDAAISDVMNIEVDGQKMQIFIPQGCTYSAGTRFYRTRRINVQDLDQFSTVAAYWNPPAEIITSPGRLNKVHESLLYTSLNPSTTFSEVKIEPNELFALIVYEALEDIKTNTIGMNRDIPELNETDNQKYQLYNNFLKGEFTKEVQPGLEHYYRVSEYIAKFYFDLPPRDVQDAWMYPSVAAAGEYNVCFRPDIAKEVLKFVGVIFGIMIRHENSTIFKCTAIGTPDSDNKMVFVRENPTTMKELFPEFLSKNNSKEASFTE